MGELRWATCVTTVPARRHDLLPRTLASLAAGGFSGPRLLVDGLQPGDAVVYAHHGLEVTTRWPTIRLTGNFVLGLWEMLVRQPDADRYAVFQDDVLCSCNLRQYLERLPCPAKGYQNLCLYPANLPPGADGKVGWHPAKNLGKGAQGLVFSRDAVVALLSSTDIVTRPLSAPNPARPWWANIDGGICCALKKAGWREYVHNPSLLGHTGAKTTLLDVRGHGTQPAPAGFRGEDFDCLDFLPREEGAVGSGKPGTELIDLLKELGITASPACPCKAHARQMDAWGVAECKARREEIINWLRTGESQWGLVRRVRVRARAAINALWTGLARKFDWSDPYVGLVDEAIRRAEQKKESGR